ncbi:T9SS type A sorting domain-containing protein [Rhodocytophaga rosea]|uniref:T9SS type A sorting domain-containing protein n=1 Tax=Rhodocytophaga rosea TaxID=2704465 RepID=A0A6C0GLY4_9BACT|nr:LamG-like jellyroll fold domain-containing protein [Rhodocytophaga rosea]QHT68824.1 T9SS type A sorting domain-containing protein [Rhodocytophaga rosea]
MKNLIIVFYTLLQLQSIFSYGQPTQGALYFNKTGSYINIPSSPSLSPEKEITVESWIKPNNSNWNNKYQTILSKKEYNDLTSFTDKQKWEVYNATNVNGENNITGFVGAVFDGRYVYFSPWWRGGDEPQSGEVLRFDTQGDYQDTNSWNTYNADNEDGKNGVRGLEGAVFDGRYIYFVPLHTENIYSSQVLRYDTQKDFNSTNSWDVYDYTTNNVAEIDDKYQAPKGFVGAVFDGKYIYFPPNPWEPHHKVLRYNTQSDFFDSSSWETYDFAAKYGPEALAGCFGAIFDGAYVYFVPQDGKGNVLRLDTRKEFSEDDAWEMFNLIDLLPPGYPPHFAGAVFDGRNIYFSPLYGGTVIKFDTKGDFMDKQYWKLTYILNLDGNHAVKGGVGPVFDGRYVYYPPMYDQVGRSGKFVIYDTYGDFEDLSSWNYYDWKTQDKQLAGFEGAVFDGQYVYFSPMNFEDPHGKILRYGSTERNGLSYSLIYNQSSSSFGSVMQRPSFQVGTTAGLRTVYLKKEANLADGEWHHMAGTYNGSVLSIYLDGQLNNQIIYTTPADIVVNEANVTIGSESGHSSSFDGLIDNISIRNIAATAEEILQHANCREFSGIDSHLLAGWLLDEGRGEVVNDLSGNNNNGVLINEPKWINLNTALKVFAGKDEEVCSDDLPFILQDYYPAGGVWTGNGVSASGLFTPSENFANTTQKLLYTYQDENGCVYSSFKKIYIRPSTGQPYISERFNAILCSGEFTTLTVDRDYSRYIWSTGDTTKSIHVSQSGTYSVKVAEGDSCLSISSESVAIQVLPDMPAPVINLTDLTSLKASNAADNLHFEWKRNNDTLPLHTQTIKITQPGFYSARVRNSNNCYSEFSEAFYFTPPQPDEILNKNLTIAPNPSNGRFQISVSDFTEDVSVYIRDQTGKILYQAVLPVREGLTIKEINLTHLPKSLYMMSFVTSYGVLHKKIIIQ